MQGAPPGGRGHGSPPPPAPARGFVGQLGKKPARRDRGSSPASALPPAAGAFPPPQELLFPQETAAEGVRALRTLGARSLPEQSMHTEGRGRHSAGPVSALQRAVMHFPSRNKVTDFSLLPAAKSWEGDRSRDGSVPVPAETAKLMKTITESNKP